MDQSYKQRTVSGSGVFRFFIVLVFALHVVPSRGESSATNKLVRPETKVITLDTSGYDRDAAPPGQFRIRFISFNDFHGSYREKDLSVGAAKFVGALTEYRKNTPMQPPTVQIVLCGGDNFSGSALSYYSTFDPDTQGEKRDNPLQRLFDRTEVVASCIGNHAFDWVPKEVRDGPGKNLFLEEHLARATVGIGQRRYRAYSSSNILDELTGRPPGGVPSYDMLVIEPIGYTIALISLTTLETPHKTVTGGTNGYTFIKPAEAAKRIMDDLQGQVDAFLFLSHLASYQDEQGRISFGRDSEDMLELVKLNPLAIITAHSHRYVSGRSDGVPIVQAGRYANGIASLDFLVDRETKKIEFESQEVVSLLPRRKELSSDPEMERIIRDAEKACHFRKIGTVRSDMPENRRKFTDIGTLICKALSTAFPDQTGSEPVLAFQHSGGIRANFSAGEITEEDCYDMLPFQGGIDLCRLSGANLLRLMREGFVNPVGYLQSYRLIFYYDRPDTPREDFRRVTFLVGDKEIEIEPNGSYWVVLDDFIVQGGDGFSKDIFDDSVLIREGPLSRDILIRFCQEDLKGDIHVESHDRPRFQVE